MEEMIHQLGYEHFTRLPLFTVAFALAIAGRARLMVCSSLLGGSSLHRQCAPLVDRLLCYSWRERECYTFRIHAHT